MPRRVPCRAVIRALSQKFAVPEYCEEARLHQRFAGPISHMVSAWDGQLTPETLTDSIVRLLINALSHAYLGEMIEEDLRNRYNLTDEWDHDETRWDQYREAIAVCVLQQHYYDHGVA